MQEKRSGKGQTRPAAERRLLWWLVSACICGGAAGCRYWYPQGIDVLQQAVFGRDGAAVAAAFAALEDSLAGTGSMERVIEVFFTDADDAY